MALDIALVNMPFATIRMPSIQLGVLHAAVAKAGFRVRTFHFNLELLRFLDARSDSAQQERNLEFLLGADDQVSPHHRFAATTAPLFDGEVARWPRPESADARRSETADFIHRLFPEFLDHCAGILLAHDPGAVGFTCTFERLPQLQLAKRLKDLRPSLWTIFGGTQVEGVMGEAVCKAFSFIDVVVRGEGEGPLVQLLEDLRSGQQRPHGGLVWRERGAPAESSEAGACGTSSETAPGLVSLKSLVRRDREVAAEPAVKAVAEVKPTIGRFVSPYPDYDDYFEQVAGTAVETQCEIELPMETSRGCWWYKKKCLFCGRSEDNLRYRTKAREAICDEMEYLASRHHVLKFMVVDPAVLEKEIAHVADDARAKGYDYRIWRQGRVFTNADTHRRIASMVNTMFFGIESLSTPVLGLMRKGHTALQALVTLKRATETGMRPTHNMIHGFPGEREEHYERLNEWLPAFFHLPPPFQLGPMGIDRASVYFDDPERYGITLGPPPPDQDPVLMLAHATGAPPELLGDLAVSVPADIPRVSGDVLDETYDLVARWKAGYRQNAGSLSWKRGPSFLVIHDERDGASNKLELPFPSDELYLATDEGATIEEIERHLAGLGANIARADIEAMLAHLVAERVMYEEDGRYLSLAIKQRAA